MFILCHFTVSYVIISISNHLKDIGCPSYVESPVEERIEKFP